MGTRDKFESKQSKAEDGVESGFGCADAAAGRRTREGSGAGWP